MTNPEHSDPLDLFRAWFADAQKSEINDPNALAMASVGADGQPSLRMVLMKDFDAAGFVFFTNYESRKGRELLAHPKAALLFHWKSLERQVRIEGPVSEVDGAEADAYFATRSRGSQIGAWASQQSQPLESRFALEKRVAQFAAKFGVSKVPRPPHWSGFRVRHDYLEFWHGRPFRLHDRLVYQRHGDGWQTRRLFP
ncbi:MAG: pyridoxamine 5'-phosphate oxidase [Alphaproteobacteria bacterium]|nr:pyridoxamine 5'-phosphate oxidase [Alphaproteobacteria bacterium]